MRSQLVLLLVVLLAAAGGRVSAARLPWWHAKSTPAATLKPAAHGVIAAPHEALLSQQHSRLVPLQRPGSALARATAGRAGALSHVSNSTLSLADEKVATVFGKHSPLVLPRLGDDSTSTELDMTLANLAGRLTSAAYCRVNQIQLWNCSRCDAVGNDFSVVSVIFDAAWDLTSYVGYLPNLNTITVSFKGTDSSSVANWMRNLQSWRLDKAYPLPEEPHALIHIGFYNMWHYSSLEANVTSAIAQLLEAHSDAKLLVTGHSMGGALAQLCALDMKFEHGIEEVRVVTFGSPRVGNKAYTDLFSGAMKESWRFTHNRDIVPSLPPVLVGFHHVAREVWLVDVETATGIDEKVLMCDETGEDPSCHNSACYLGICTSIADHLTYLKLHMYHDESEC